MGWGGVGRGGVGWGGGINRKVRRRTKHIYIYIYSYVWLRVGSIWKIMSRRL